MKVREFLADRSADKRQRLVEKPAAVEHVRQGTRVERVETPAQLHDAISRHARHRLGP